MTIVILDTEDHGEMEWVSMDPFGWNQVRCKRCGLVWGIHQTLGWRREIKGDPYAHHSYLGRICTMDNPQPDEDMMPQGKLVEDVSLTIEKGE